MSYQSIDIVVSDQHNQLVEDVLVRIYSEDGSLIFTEGTTNAQGTVSFLLETMTYTMRFYKFSVGFKQPQLLVIEEGQNAYTYDVSADVLSPNASSNPLMCRCFGYFIDMFGKPMANLTMHFTAAFNPVVLNSALVVPQSKMVVTDSKGYACIDLIRCARYEVLMGISGDELRQVNVPESSAADLPMLLYPRVSKVTWPSESQEVAIGSPLTLHPTVYLTSGITLSALNSGDILWKLDPDNTASLTPLEKSLEIVGNQSGVLNITATRVDNSIIYIPNLPIGGMPHAVTIL